MADGYTTSAIPNFDHPDDGEQSMSARPKPPVFAACVRLSHAGDTLEKLAAALGERLAGVRRQVPRPERAGQGDTTQAHNSQLTTELDAQAERLEAVAERLEALLDEIEV